MATTVTPRTALVDSELKLDVLKASISIKVIAHPTVLARFRTSLDQLISQTFAHGMSNVQTHVEKLEL